MAMMPEENGMARGRAVFLDKDGTLIHDVPYNVEPDLIRLQDDAIEALAKLHAAGYALIVVTNQSGVARGYFPEQALQGVEARMRKLLGNAGIPLRGFYHCPHHPEGTVARYAVACGCRKPAPGMLLRAAAEHGIDLGASWMIGDILHDVEAGRAAGCRTILLDNGNETEWQLTPRRLPHYRIRSLLEAAHLIINAGDRFTTEGQKRGNDAENEESDRPASCAAMAPVGAVRE